MYERLLKLNNNHSALILGPRGIGKTSWLKHSYPEALYFDLLNEDLYREFLARPTRLATKIPKGYSNFIIIDEIQKIPSLLNEVHRLIEHENYKFIMTGSSARKLRRKGVNLLAGRAFTYQMYPLTPNEIGNTFNFEKALMGGLLPTAYDSAHAADYLSAYVKTYLREEVLQESLTRNFALFTHFLEAASFSQGETINFSEIAREVSSNRHTICNFFEILNDLLIAYRLPVFNKRAKRKLLTHEKFYYFDTGIYRSIRPAGPLDSPQEIDGAALETLFLQNILAINSYFKLGYQCYYWRTHTNIEVDFVIYGNRGIHAFEIKRKQKIDNKDGKGLTVFGNDYPEANLYLLYGGSDSYQENNIQVIPFKDFIRVIEKYI